MEVTRQTQGILPFPRPNIHSHSHGALHHFDAIMVFPALRLFPRQRRPQHVVALLRVLTDLLCVRFRGLQRLCLSAGSVRSGCSQLHGKELRQFVAVALVVLRKHDIVQHLGLDAWYEAATVIGLKLNRQERAPPNATHTPSQGATRCMKLTCIRALEYSS